MKIFTRPMVYMLTTTFLFALSACSSADKKLIDYAKENESIVSVSNSGSVHTVEFLGISKHDAGDVFEWCSNASKLISIDIEGDFSDSDLAALKDSKAIKFIYLESDFPGFTLDCLNNFPSEGVEIIHLVGAGESINEISESIFLRTINLTLEACILTTKDIKVLSDAKLLEILALDSSVKTPGQLSYLSKLGNLQELYLNDCTLDMADANAISKMKSVRKLQLFDSVYPSGFIAFLREHRPDITISY